MRKNLQHQPKKKKKKKRKKSLGVHSCTLLESFLPQRLAFMQSTTRTKQKRAGEKTTTKEQIRQNWRWRCEKLGQRTKFTPQTADLHLKGIVKNVLRYQFQFSSVQDGFYALGKAHTRSTLSTLSRALPLKRFQCSSDWRQPSLALTGLLTLARLTLPHASALTPAICARLWSGHRRHRPNLPWRS